MSHSRKNCNPCKAAGISLGKPHIARPYVFTNNNCPTIGKSKAQNTSKLAHSSNYRVSGNYIFAKVTKNYRIHCKSCTPDKLVANCRK